MKACVWYQVDEKIPPVSGYYLAFKGFSIGDNETDTGYYYWDAKYAEWKDGSLSHSRSARIIWWTDADPARWYDEEYNMRRRDEISVAEKDAWTAVERAIEKYNMIRALTKV
jgi:hypothetical protein